MNKPVLTNTLNNSSTSTDELDTQVDLGGDNLDSVKVLKQGLYPEGVEYDPNSKQFFLSSINEGTIYAVTEDGQYRPFIQDDRLISSIGLRIDPDRNRLLAAVGDNGLGTRSTPQTENSLAALGIYDLTTGQPISFVDLDDLRPGSNHLANDLAIDRQGNTYITDSLSPIIYKVDPQGNPSVFLESDRFLGEGANLNGIVFHPDGYLIAAKYNEGSLFKIPIDNPENFSQIQLPQPLTALDGLILTDSNSLVGITNETSNVESNQIFALDTQDNWQSAEIVDRFTTKDEFPTTGTLVGDDVYVLYSQLNKLLDPNNTVPADQFTIQQVGSKIPVDNFTGSNSQFAGDELFNLGNNSQSDRTYDSTYALNLENYSLGSENNFSLDISTNDNNLISTEMGIDRPWNFPEFG